MLFLRSYYLTGFTGDQVNDNDVNDVDEHYDDDDDDDDLENQTHYSLISKDNTFCCCWLDLKYFRQYLIENDPAKYLKEG